MQINMPDSGTFFFISDHCHVIENVSYRDLLSAMELTPRCSGAMVSRKAGWPEIIRHGS
jgi:hypothetical protein